MAKVKSISVNPEAIKRIAKEKGKSLNYISEAAGYDRCSMAKCAQAGKMSLPMLMAFCTICGCKKEDIMANEAKPEPKVDEKQTTDVSELVQVLREQNDTLLTTLAGIKILHDDNLKTQGMLLEQLQSIDKGLTYVGNRLQAILNAINR